MQNVGYRILNARFIDGVLRLWSMAVEPDDTVNMENGDTLEERLDKVDVSEDDTCSTDEMRERLGSEADTFYG